MNQHWQLRTALYRFFHNWPVLAACFLLGSLLGWLAGSLWPAYYKASREVSVALNPYRTFSDARFLALARPRYANLDNYQYWQMDQLEAAVYRKALLEKTLGRLRTQNPVWNAVEIDALRSMVDVDWRTAGVWRFNVFHPDQTQALELARVWSETAAEEVTQAVAAGRDLFLIDARLSAVNIELQAAQSRQSALARAEPALRRQQETLSGLPPGQPLPPEIRWKMFALTTAYAADDPAWNALLEIQPAPGAPAADYLEWSGAALGVIQGDQERLPGQISALETENAELKAEYEAVARLNQALSPNLDIENIGEPQVQAMRPRATLALIGGFLGILAAAVFALFSLTRRLSESEQTDV